MNDNLSGRAILFKIQILKGSRVKEMLEENGAGQQVKKI